MNSGTIQCLLNNQTLDCNYLYRMPQILDTPQGIYELEVGLYLQKSDGGFQGLRVVTPDGGMANDFAFLTMLRTLSSVSFG